MEVGADLYWLDPCPDCASQDTQTVVDKDGVYIRCKECGLCGHKKGTVGEAANVWNEQLR